MVSTVVVEKNVATAFVVKLRDCNLREIVSRGQLVPLVQCVYMGFITLTKQCIMESVISLYLCEDLSYGVTLVNTSVTVLCFVQLSLY